MSTPGSLDILGDVLDLLQRQQDYATALREYVTLYATEIEQLWTRQAEMRDDLHAVVGRIEGLARAHTGLYDSLNLVAEQMGVDT